jgi:L-threonylcarbamoyladenylate synthase
LTDRVWPGPLTVILTAHPDVPSAVVAGDGTVRLGVPDDRLVRRVSDESGPLVVATLCRTDGHPLTTVGEVLSHCGDAEIALVVDGGTCAGPGPTVVDCRVSPPEVLSEGKLPSTYVEAVLLMGTWRRKWFSKPAGDLR